jgi:hypothetical protein
LRSLESRSLNSVVAGTSDCETHAFCIGDIVHVAPHEIGESALRFELKKGPRIADRGFDLAAMTHDALIGEKTRHVRLAPTRDDLGIETLESLRNASRFAQDRDPGKPRLKPSRTSFSHRARPSRSGTPHSVS